MKHIHILGVCGTFMAGIALLAKAMGFKVTGMDHGVYPPMSTLLDENGIDVIGGFDPTDLPEGDCTFVVGNALSRGNPAVEHILNHKLPFCSGPEWLFNNVIAQRRVIAVAGTHGKTSTSGMVTHILRSNGIDCGYLIGGIPGNENKSAESGQSDWFVIEADEYDTAFFDKRSKFVHYHPELLILNNLEFDHADIFEDLAAIEKQFHHLIRMVPGEGFILYNLDDDNLSRVLKMGCWSQLASFSTNDDTAEARMRPLSADYSRFIMEIDGESAEVAWPLFGRHNAMNALAASLACNKAGIGLAQAAGALAHYRAPKLRMQILLETPNLVVYRDFAHHPTAIATTLEALRARHSGNRLVLVLDPRSNTMKRGSNNADLVGAVERADRVFVINHPGLDWQPESVFRNVRVPVKEIGESPESAVVVSSEVQQDDVVIIMSNGGIASFSDAMCQNLRTIIS